MVQQRMTDDTTHKAAQKRTRPRGRPRLDEQLAPRILDAAERLFADRGPVSVSIRDIAAEAGLPHSAIYRYFEGKDEVLRQVLARGRRRQIEHEREGRHSGRTTEGALEWIMEHNRAYFMLVARLAVEGETTTSLGLDPGENVTRRSLEVLQDGTTAFELRTDHDPRMVVAAVTALALGYVMSEEWVLDSIGMHDCDREEVRAAIDAILASMMALSRGPAGS
jgi:AcrR family transcriptional regulator